MKKILYIYLTLSLSLVYTSQLNAQVGPDSNIEETTNTINAFQEAKSYISLGYGYSILNSGMVLNLLDEDVSSNVSASSFGPVVLKYEYAVTETIGIGASFGYSSLNLTETNIVESGGMIHKYTYSYKGPKITASARINYHFLEHKVIDPYIGFGFGFRQRTISYESNDPSDLDSGIIYRTLFPVAAEATIGSRFIFSKHLGAFIEMGVAHGFIQGGLVGKF